MEVCNFFLTDSIELLYLHVGGDALLDGHLIIMVQLHEHDMEDVDDDENVDSINFDLVAYHEIAEDGQVDDVEGGITARDPPLNSGILLGQGIENALDNQTVKSRLLDCSLNSDVRDAKEDGVHNNK